LFYPNLKQTIFKAPNSGLRKAINRVVEPDFLRKYIHLRILGANAEVFIFHI